MNNAPIGVFDSGFGGLSVWRELRRVLPAESLVYFGDGKHCPYGPKPTEEVIGYVDQAVRFLIGKGVKMVVVACNAATASAIDYLRATYSIPFVGMEPAVKPAAGESRSGVIGILATEATLRGRLYLDTSSKFADRVKIVPAVGEGFVELVEAGREDTPEAVAAAEKAVRPMLDAGADRIVLGCTHYPFMAGAIRRAIGDREVELVDPAPAVARRAQQVLAQAGLLAETSHRADYEFYTAADEDYRTRLRAKAAQLR